MTKKTKSGTGGLFFKLALLSGAAIMVSGCSYDLMGPDGGGTAEWEKSIIANEKPAEDSYAAGKKQYKKGLYGLALKNFQTSLSHQPKSVKSLNAVAATYDKLGRFDLSRRYYARALALDPESPQTLNNIGYSFALQEDFVSARAYFERARKAGGSANTKSAVGINLSALDTAEGRGPPVSQMASVVAPLNASAKTAKAPNRNVPVANSGDSIRMVTVLEDGGKAAIEDALEIAAVAVTPTKIRNTRKSQSPVLAHAPAPQPAPVGSVEPVGVVEVKVGMVKVEQVALVADKPKLQPKLLVKDPAPTDQPVVLAKLADPVAQSQPVAEISRPATRSKPVASTSDPVIEISNGAGRRYLASRTRDFLAARGVEAVLLTNADNFNYAETAVFYREGYKDHAHTITHMFPMPVAMHRVDEQYSDIRVQLGADSLEFDDRMQTLRTAGS